MQQSQKSFATCSQGTARATTNLTFCIYQKCEASLKTGAFASDTEAILYVDVIVGSIHLRVLLEV